MYELDDINLDLLDLLQTDGRMSYRELGERVGLTAPAVAERVRKLREAGVIVGFGAVLDYELLGFPIQCIVRLNTSRAARGVDEKLRAMPEVIEADRVTGSESHVLRARVRSTQHLEELLHRLWDEGDSTTNIVTSSPVERRPMNLRAVGGGRPEA